MSVEDRVDVDVDLDRRPGGPDGEQRGRVKQMGRNVASVPDSEVEREVGLGLRLGLRLRAVRTVLVVAR